MNALYIFNSFFLTNCSGAACYASMKGAMNTGANAFSMCLSELLHQGGVYMSLAHSSVICLHESDLRSSSYAYMYMYSIQYGLNSGRLRGCLDLPCTNKIHSYRVCPIKEPF